MSLKLSNLYELVREWRKGKIQKPAHQRDPRWPHSMIRRWAEGTADETQPRGLITLYTVGDSDTVYVNDGLSRIMASVAIADDPKAYGFSDDSAGIDALRRAVIAVQVCEYENHTDAMGGLQLLNTGTTLTGKEYAHGFVAYMPRFESVWKAQLDHFHSRIDGIASHIGKASRKGSKVEQGHKYIRHNYTLLTRMITNERRLVSYGDIAIWPPKRLPPRPTTAH